MCWLFRVLALSLRVFCLFYKNKQNVSRSKTGLVEFSIRFHGISFESHEITQTDKVIYACHFECFVCFTKTSEMYREVRRGLSSSRYDFMRFLSNPMKSLELTKCCFNVTSSVLFVLQKQAKCIEK